MSKGWIMWKKTSKTRRIRWLCKSNKRLRYCFKRRSWSNSTKKCLKKMKSINRRLTTLKLRTLKSPGRLNLGSSSLKIYSSCCFPKKSRSQETSIQSRMPIQGGDCRKRKRLENERFLRKSLLRQLTLLVRVMISTLRKLKRGISWKRSGKDS